MKMNTPVAPGVRGDIEVFRRFDDGREEVILEKRNLVLDTGMDLVARALGGNIYINGMYMAYENTAGVVSPAAVTADRVAMDYQTTYSAGTLGFVRSANIAQPSFDTSDDTLYATNQVAFVAISTSDQAVDSGSNDVTDGLSQFYGAALAFLDPNDMENDILFAAVNFEDIAGAADQIEKIAGAQIGIRWTITFTQP
jgi:hypothetical protein